MVKIIPGSPCPICGGKLKRNGCFRGPQRYYCKPCKRAFTEDMEYFDLKPEEVLNKWVEVGKEKYTLGKTAKHFRLTRYKVKKIIETANQDKIPHFTKPDGAIDFSGLKKELRKEKRREAER